MCQDLPTPKKKQTPLQTKNNPKICLLTPIKNESFYWFIGTIFVLLNVDRLVLLRSRRFSVFSACLCRTKPCSCCTICWFWRNSLFAVSIIKSLLESGGGGGGGGAILWYSPFTGSVFEFFWLSLLWILCWVFRNCVVLIFCRCFSRLTWFDR